MKFIFDFYLVDMGIGIRREYYLVLIEGMNGRIFGFLLELDKIWLF